MRTATCVFVLVTAIILATAAAAMAEVVADYRFDVAGSAAVDTSGNGNDGTLIGFTDYTPGYADDPANPGYTSDGKIRLVGGSPLEYIETPIVASTFVTDSFTIEAMTSLHADLTSWHPLVGYVIPSEAFFYWGSHSASPHWHIDNGGPFEVIAGYDDVLDDGGLHHYAIVYDADEGKLHMYLDHHDPIATVDADLSGAVPEDDTGVLLIGSHAGSSWNEVWDGRIDRIRFSDHVVDPGNFIPEPATLALLALGGAGLLARRRKA